MINNTAIINRKVQQSGIYPDIYEDNINDVSLESSRLQVFLEIQKDTMQVPFQSSSMLERLMEGIEKAFDAAIYLCYNAFSNWDWGISHSMSIRKVANIFSVSCQYVQQAIARLCVSTWFKRLSGLHKIGKFELKHHFCEYEDTPFDKDGRPAKCAMPRGEGGLFERLEAGDICWKSLVIWVLLKINSDFTTGLTEPISIAQLREWTRFGNTTICDCIKELVEAGMLEKLERRPQEAQSYQLYPKPYAKRRERKPMSERTWRDMRAMGNWRYSFNEQWRVNVATSDIQYRPNSKAPFRNASDCKKYHEMPKSIRQDFDVVVRFYADLPMDLKQNPCPT
ncbi:MAG: hypothetical protein F4090_01505 [Nitrospira sp. SB0672_bin_25]|nr:hypothetical protein [Nitrospira sp. SB0672_bin_25]